MKHLGQKHFAARHFSQGFIAGAGGAIIAAIIDYVVKFRRKRR